MCHIVISYLSGDAKSEQLTVPCAYNMHDVSLVIVKIIHTHLVFNLHIIY